jgi:ATP-dependent RNA helicase RhlB
MAVAAKSTKLEKAPQKKAENKVEVKAEKKTAKKTPAVKTEKKADEKKQTAQKTPTQEKKAPATTPSTDKVKTPQKNLNLKNKPEKLSSAAQTYLKPEVKITQAEADATKLETKASDTEVTISNPEMTIFNPEVKIPNPEVKIPNPEVKIPNPEVKIPNPEVKTPNPEVKITPTEPSFDSFPLPLEIIERIQEAGFKIPTEIQVLSLPHTLLGKDVAGFAQTGTGKTAVYSITLGSRFLSQKIQRGKPGQPAAIVLVPTRELAVQVESDIASLLQPLNITSCSVFGGVDIEKQAKQILNSTDIVVATTGRLLDLFQQKKISFENISVFVCDEVDRMFDMGFVNDVEYILKNLPEFTVQKLFFSATGSEKVRELAFEFLEKPEYIEANPEKIAPDKIKQTAYAVPAVQKFSLLMALLKQDNPKSAIIFCNTKVVAEWLGYKLCCNNFSAEVLTGDLPQKKRLELIQKVKDGLVKILIATDVLSRGLHVSTLSHVYNFDIPDDAESFIHRIGRTARAGAEGAAFSFVCEDYGYNMAKVQNLLGFSLPVVRPKPEFLNLEDKSDFPFDSRGRVKMFGVEEIEPPKKPEFAEKTLRFIDKPIQQPEEKLIGLNLKQEKYSEPKNKLEEPNIQKQSPEALPFEKPQFQKPQFEKQSLEKQQPEKPQFQKPQFEKQRQEFPRVEKSEFQPTATQNRIPNENQFGQPYQKNTHKEFTNKDTFTPRRDERAKEIVEQALAAAKAAADKRRSLSQPPPPSQAVAAVLAIGEKAGQIVGTIQGTLQGLLENNRPLFTSLLERFKAAMHEAQEKAQKSQK